MKLQKAKETILNKNLIHIGTSGWSYKDWRGNFYPENIKPIDFLKFYSEHFSTVEINSSFYHMLRDKIVIHWSEEVPSDFIFALKANREITHIKKLEDPEQIIPDFMQSLSSFKNKLGPILFQLPPSFGFNNISRLRSFINVLPKDFSYVFEFRNKSWFNEKTYEILKERNIALCIYNLSGYQSPLELTTDFTYIRYHGTEGIGVGEYSIEDIEELSGYIAKFVSQNKNVYCYFNNGANGVGIVNAKQLKKSLQQKQIN